MKTVNEIVKLYHQEVPLHLCCSYPEENHTNLPTVLIFPTWAGQDMFSHHKSYLMAQKGYTSVVADLFGYARTGQDPEECAELIAPFMEDRAFLRERIQLILTHLKKDPRVDPSNIIAIGYCFGGLCVLDAVRNNLGVKGGVSIHGLYGKPGYDIPAKYTAQLLALHGYRDPMNPPDQLAAFQEELSQACKDWQVISFGMGMHAFTNPEVCDEKRGTVYDPVLDKRTTKYVEQFVKEVFA